MSDKTFKPRWFIIQGAGILNGPYDTSENAIQAAEELSKEFPGLTYGVFEEISQIVSEEVTEVNTVVMRPAVGDPEYVVEVYSADKGWVKHHRCPWRNSLHYTRLWMYDRKKNVCWVKYRVVDREGNIYASAD